MDKDASLGKIEYNDATYIGEIQDEKPAGFGILALADRSKFRGKFRDGVKVRGVYEWPNGDTYMGEFVGG
jgi:hypothetical protein